MNALIRIAFVPIVLSIFSCSRGPRGSEYFGAADNERRVFSIKATGLFGSTTEATAIYRQEGTTEIGGKLYYKIVITFDGLPGATSDISYVRLADDGIFSRKSTDPKSSENLEIPFPPDIGRKWNYSQDDMSLSYEITAIETLDTAENAFPNCLKIVGKGKKAGMPVEVTSYTAPKVGLVKMTVTGAGFAMEWKLRLK